MYRQVESKIAEHHTKLDTATASASSKPLSPKRRTAEEQESTLDKKKPVKGKKDEKSTPKRKTTAMRPTSSKDIGKTKPKELNYRDANEGDVDWIDSDSDENSAYPTIERKISSTNIIGRALLKSCLL